MKELLLIEDDKQLATMYAKKFAKSDFHVTNCVDGSKALEMLHGYNFDVIVLDLMLPGLSGVDLLGMIRTDRKLCKIPIVVYTNHGDDATKKKCLTYGTDEFILKVDSTPESLCQTINKVITEKEIETV